MMQKKQIENNDLCCYCKFTNQIDCSEPHMEIAGKLHNVRQSVK